MTLALIGAALAPLALWLAVLRPNPRYDPSGRTLAAQAVPEQPGAA